MGQPQLTLLPGGKGDHPDDPPSDSPDTPLLDYREFLPQGDTRFGVLDEANEAAFRAQFPELIPVLDQLREEIRKWREKFKNLPSTAAKEQAELLDWTLHIQSTTSPEATSPGENPFKVSVQCIDSPASGFEHLQKVYDWTQRIPAMFQKIKSEKEEAEQWYQKAVETINEQLIQWTLGEDKPSLDLSNLEESVTILRQLPWKHKTFLRGGVQKFLQNVNTLEREGQRASTASQKEKNLKRIQTILAEKLPTLSNLQQWDSEFRDYQRGEDLFRIHSPLSFSYNPVPVAEQKAQAARAAQLAEEAIAQRRAELEAERQARAIEAARAKTARRVHQVFALGLALAVAGVLATSWAITEKPRKAALEREKAALALEDALERRAELEQYKDQLKTDMGEMEADFETLIGEIVEEAVEEGLKNQDAMDNYVEFGDFTLLFQAILVAFNERSMEDIWIRMKDMTIDITPEEGGGPPYFYTLEIKYSVEETIRGVTHERALLRPHVPFDRVPANPAAATSRKTFSLVTEVKP